MSPNTGETPIDSVDREAQLSLAREAIASRLRGVCTHMPEQEFDILVQQMAELELKYRLRRGLKA
jgi:hypothetical protein